MNARPVPDKTQLCSFVQLWHYLKASSLKSWIVTRKASDTGHRSSNLYLSKILENHQWKVILSNLIFLTLDYILKILIHVTGKFECGFLGQKETDRQTKKQYMSCEPLLYFISITLLFMMWLIWRWKYRKYMGFKIRKIMV